MRPLYFFTQIALLLYVLVCVNYYNLAHVAMNASGWARTGAPGSTRIGNVVGYVATVAKEIKKGGNITIVVSGSSDALDAHFEFAPNGKSPRTLYFHINNATHVRGVVTSLNKLLLQLLVPMTVRDFVWARAIHMEDILGLSREIGLKPRLVLYHASQEAMDEAIRRIIFPIVHPVNTLETTVEVFKRIFLGDFPTSTQLHVVADRSAYPGMCSTGTNNSRQ